jgi:hypothetical protein
LDEAQLHLRNIEPRLRDVIEAAWLEYQTDSLRHRHSPRTQASLLHDLIELHARRVLDGVRGISFAKVRGLFLVNYRGLVVLRFKKLDRALRSRSNQTQQSMSFLNQWPLPSMPDAATRLQAGYQLNSLRTAIDACLVVCPNGQRVEWSWELGGIAAQPPAQVPLRPASPTRVRVKVTKLDAKKRTADDETVT